MDVKTLLHNLHEEVSCSICLSPFTEPKTLPCLHSFCLHCLRGHQRTSGRHDIITCPECRRESRIDGGNLNKLPTNFRINSLLDILAIKECSTTEAKCGNCDKKSAHSFYCFQCCGLWCDDCVSFHNGMRANKEHRVLALKDFKDEDFEEVMKRPAFCGIQGHERKELEFFCKSCDVAICSSCVVTTHEGHAKILLDAAANECKLQMKRFIETQKQMLQQNNNDITKLDKNCGSVQVQVHSVKRSVQTFADNIIAVVETKKEEIFAEVENLAKETLQRLGIQKRQLEQKMKTINTTLAKTEALLKRNNSAEIIQFNTSLRAFSKELETREVFQGDEALPSFVYVANEKSLNNLFTQGIGYIKRTSNETVPLQSNAEGNGIKKATVGLKAQFVLTTRNAVGNQCHDERDEIKLEIKNSHGGDCVTGMQIEDCKDGTYKIGYFVSEAGQLNASVKVNGDHVRGSPLTVQVKQRQYKPVLSFGKQGSSVGMLWRPWGVAVNNRDEIAVTENANHRVQIFRSDGTYLRSIGRPGNQKGEFSFPRGIAFDQDGKLLVVDNGNSRVQIFDEQGKYLGELEGQLKNPHDLCLDSNGITFVTDAADKVIKTFSPEREILSTVGGGGLFSFPLYCVPYKHLLIVSNFYEHCVKVFDRERIFLYRLGGPGHGIKQFQKPGCLRIDKAGNVMVCDEENHRIQVFKPNGEFVAMFGSKGSEAGQFNIPCSIAVLSDGRLVVSDYENNRIHIFE